MRIAFLSITIKPYLLLFLIFKKRLVFLCCFEVFLFFMQNKFMLGLQHNTDYVIKKSGRVKNAADS